MTMSALESFCDTVSDVAVSEAKTLRERFVGLVGDMDADPAHVFTVFAFMNWTFAAGIWSNISNRRLRRDLMSGLKDALVMKLACELADGTPARAAKAVQLTDAFNHYQRDYKAQMLSQREADSRTATLFALKRIQEKCGIDDSIMDGVVPRLVTAEGLAAELESVAAKVNEAMAEEKRKGFFGRLFGG